MNTDQPGIVLVPVPEEHLAAVYETLAREMRGAPPPLPKALADAPAATSPSSGDWTLDELRRLKQMVATRPIALLLLDITAADPDVPITFSELCDRADADPGKARGELASLSNLCWKHFDHFHWPVTSERELGRWRYFMTAEMAALWLRA